MSCSLGIKINEAFTAKDYEGVIESLLDDIMSFRYTGKTRLALNEQLDWVRILHAQAIRMEDIGLDMRYILPLETFE